MTGRGRATPEGGDGVRADDRGLLYGDGVFDTLLALDGRCVDLARHLDRLARGAAALGIPFDRKAAGAAARAAALGQPGERAVRITLTRGPGPGLGTAGAGPPTLFAIARPVPWTEEDRARGVSGVYAGARRVPPECLDPAVKSLNYLPNVLARREAEARGAREAIFLSLAGDVVEATVANVFVVRDGVVRTPPLSSGCFPGLVREDVLRLAAEDGTPAREERLRPDDLAEADEAFLTSSLAGVLPLTRLEGRPVGAGVPGPVARRLHMLYRKRLETGLLASDPSGAATRGASAGLK